MSDQNDNPKQETPSVTYREAIEAHNILNGLPANGVDDETLFDLEDNLLALKPHVSAFQRKRQRLARKYAERDEQGNPVTKQQGRSETYVIEEENQEDFDEAIQNLMDREVHVPGRVEVPRSEIKKLGLRLGQQAALRCITDRNGN